jgi:DNA-binding NarL/FixJ family response regulator
MKILLVDDHMLFREGMKLIFGKLDPQTVVIEAGDLDEALRAAALHGDIGLVLFDLGLPGASGLDAFSEFRRQHEGLRTVVLSGQEDLQTVLDALSRGAMGFIPKTTSVDALSTALRTVLRDGIYLPSALFETLPPPRKPEPVHAKRLTDFGLTDRQLQVFRLVIQGKSNKAIARDLCIAESTIKQHVKPILKRLNVTSRVGAIVEVGRLGISL